jgi:hypothetical protein
MSWARLDQMTEEWARKLPLDLYHSTHMQMLHADEQSVFWVLTQQIGGNGEPDSSQGRLRGPGRRQIYMFDRTRSKVVPLPFAFRVRLVLCVPLSSRLVPVFCCCSNELRLVCVMCCALGQTYAPVVWGDETGMQQCDGWHQHVTPRITAHVCAATALIPDVARLIAAYSDCQLRVLWLVQCLETSKQPANPSLPGYEVSLAVPFVPFASSSVLCAVCVRVVGRAIWVCTAHRLES